MKTGPHFKLSKSSKRILATIPDRHKAGEFKRWAIECEVAEERAKHMSVKSVDKSAKD